MKKILKSTIRRLLCLILVWQLGLVLPMMRIQGALMSVAYAEEEVVGDEEVLNSDEYTEAMEGTDAAMAAATPTVYDQTDVNWAEQNVGGIISYLMFMTAGIVAIKAAIKCPQMWSVYSLIIYFISGISHILSEAINYIVYFDKIQQRASAYTDKVEVYGGTDTTTQLDSLKQAKGIHEDLETMLNIKQVAMGVATAGYLASAIVATIENLPTAGWASKIQTAAFISCQFLSVDESLRHELFAGTSTERILESTYASQTLLQGNPSNVQAYFSFKEWISLLQGETNQSISIDEYNAHHSLVESVTQAQANRTGFSFSRAIKQIAIFATNIIIPIAYAEEKTDDSSMWQIALDVVVGLLPALALTKTVLAFFSTRQSRAVILWAFVALGGAAEAFIKLEKDKVTKRIAEYDEIISKIEQSSGGTNNLGSTGPASLVGQSVAQNRSTLESKTAMGCVNSQFQSDPNCTCTSSNSCYSTTSLSKNSQEWSSDFPSWGSTITNNSTGLVDSLAKGDYGSASKIGSSSGKFASRANRAFNVAQDHMNKASNGQFNLGREKEGMMKALKAKVLSIMSEQQMKDMFASKNAIPETKDKPNVNEAKNLLTGIAKLEKQTLKNKSNDWKMDFGLKAMDKEKEEARPSVSTDQALNNYEYDAKDVHGDDVNIFDVVHSRYVRSYDRLFEKAKEVPTTTTAP